MIFSRLLCRWDWHRWVYSYSLKRYCLRCNHRQTFARVGDVTGWMDV